MPNDSSRLSPIVRILIATVVACLLGALLGAAALADEVLPVGMFSRMAPTQDLPDGWERMSFRNIDNRTTYSLVQRDSMTVLQAASKGGASGVVHRRRIDPTEYPILEWRWRVSNVLPDGDARTKDGDDYPARIYVTFDYDLGFGGRLKRRALKALGYDDIPSRALNYVWANRVDAGTVFPSAYTDWVMMLPLQSGSERCETWVTERRNIVEDYRRAFGEDPPPITGIALMTDTDNTGGKAIAYYGDVTFRKQTPDAGPDTEGVESASDADDVGTERRE